MERGTYVDLPSAQQLVPPNGLVVMYPRIDLRLIGVDHEGALFVPKAGEHLGRMRKVAEKTHYQLHSEPADFWRWLVLCSLSPDFRIT